jgi:stage II sporulation protein D
MLAILTVFAGCAGCSSHWTKPVPMHGPIVRVRLSGPQDQALVKATQPPLISSSSDTQPRSFSFPADASVQVVLAPDGAWRVGGIAAGSGELLVQPTAEGSVSIDGKAYRGRFRLVPSGAAPGKFDVVNDVDVDSYLKGVLASELLPRWMDEAYKAQAIVARTYALYECATTGQGKPWDVFDDARSQVYGGISAETPRSIRAADETAGVVVAYGPAGQERIFRAYFSSCCGGISVSAYDAFNIPHIPPLGDQNIGALCNASPKFNWAPIVMRKDELTRRMKIWGQRKNHPIQNLGRVEAIEIQYVNRFQRPIRFLITDSTGTRYSLTCEETRSACNAGAEEKAPLLPSSFFKTINEPDVIRFVEGHGFGHGVGMCQWCTEARAEQGMRCEQMVQAAYPQARLVYAYQP